MKQYFRPATAGDFEDPQIEVANHIYLTTAQKSKIAEGKHQEVIEELNKHFGIGRIQLKNIIMRYDSFLQAKNDFELGRAVMVAY